MAATATATARSTCRRSRTTPTTASPASSSRSIPSASRRSCGGSISPTKTRARIYDRNGYLILDSRNLYIPGEVLRLDLPPPNEKKPNFFKRGWNAVKVWLGRGDLPRYHELGPEAGKDYPEVAQALSGAQSAYLVRITDAGEVIVSVAVPVQRFRAVRGALVLSTQGGDINQAVEAERVQIFKLFLILLAVMVVLSVFFARTIANPMKRLAESAERVRHRIRSRVEIPDLTSRGDEIGDLSGALRDMTSALYSRIEAIESFAADVAHELKNPLTSLRSAVETLPLAKTPESQKRLLEVIQHDVKRLDRLISDISDASRLDAELQRNDVGAGRYRQAAQHRRLGAERDAEARRQGGAELRGRRAAWLSWCRVTTRGSARWSTT